METLVQLAGELLLISVGFAGGMVITMAAATLIWETIKEIKEQDKNQDD